MARPDDEWNELVSEITSGHPPLERTPETSL
jgi:hypothetical protein